MQVRIQTEVRLVIRRQRWVGILFSPPRMFATSWTQRLPGLHTAQNTPHWRSTSGVGVCYVCICVYAQIHFFSHAYSIENNSQGNSLYSALEWCCTILICPYNNIVPFDGVIFLNIWSSTITTCTLAWMSWVVMIMDSSFRLCTWLYSWNRWFWWTEKAHELHSLIFFYFLWSA